jgi:diaminopimelate epimerase
MVFETRAGNIHASASGNRAIIRMDKAGDIQLNKLIKVKGRGMKVHHINTGVPHTILIYKDIGKLDLSLLSPPIRYNKAFPRGTNVDYVQLVSRHNIKMRTYERGVEAETFACGTGAIASAIISALLGYAKSPVEVLVKGGILKILFDIQETNDHRSARPQDYRGEARPRPLGRAIDSISNICLEGEAKIVYEGTI